MRSPVSSKKVGGYVIFYFLVQRGGGSPAQPLKNYYSRARARFYTSCGDRDQQSRIGAMSGAHRRDRGSHHQNQQKPYARPASAPRGGQGTLGTLLGYAAAPLKWGASFFLTEHEEEDNQESPREETVQVLCSFDSVNSCTSDGNSNDVSDSYEICPRRHVVSHGSPATRAHTHAERIHKKKTPKRMVT